MKLQVTFYDKKGQYKPVSTIIDVIDKKDYINNKAKYQKQAMLKICHNRYMTPDELQKQGYTQVRVREYDLFKIELKKRIDKLNKTKIKSE